MTAAVDPAVVRQIDGLALTPDRPLLVTDADEVLFMFMEGVERHLSACGLYFDWSSFALSGNIRRQSDDQPVTKEEQHQILLDFFAGHTELLDPVEQAAETLQRLSARAQIVVLSNVPIPHREARIRALQAHGMAYPLIANIGAKGPAVRALAAMAGRPVLFIDDIPRNHGSVRQDAPDVHCIHFVADRRLAALLGPAADAHHCAADWAGIERIIATILDAT